MWDYLDGVPLHMATVATRKRWQPGLHPGWFGQQSGVCAGGTGEGAGAAGARGARPRLGSQAPRPWWDLSPPADRHPPRSHWPLPALGSWTPRFSLSASLCLPPLGLPVSLLLSLCSLLSFVPWPVSLSTCPPARGPCVSLVGLIPSHLSSRLFPGLTFLSRSCLFACVSLSLPHPVWPCVSLLRGFSLLLLCPPVSAATSPFT